jgi:hypothetical protein
MIRFTIVAVHPTVTVVRTTSGQTEVPTEWFPATPKVDQEWDLDLKHQPTEPEQLDRLNAYLVKD